MTAVVIVGLLAIAGCQQAASARPGQLSVVVAFYPFQFIAERVAGPYAAVQNLTYPGEEPHDLELTAQQVVAVTDADLVVYERSFQPAVDEAVAETGNPHVLDTTTVVPLMTLTQEGDTDLGHSSHDHGLDPHAWLDPTNMITITDAVAARLAAIDPTHAQAYRANADTLDAQLRKLDRDFATALAHCARSQFVTTHAAFGYLARRYHLEQIPINGLTPDAQPSPSRIAAVQAEARQYHITTIFSETLSTPAVADAIARDLHLRTDVLDPLEGLTAHSRGTDYLSVMRANLTALRTANGCSS